MNEPAAIWLDMQLPASICGWVAEHTGLPCEHLQAMGMERALDQVVFDRAGGAGAIVVTKDQDFARLVQEHGAPPAVIWLRCGNCTTTALLAILAGTLPRSMELIRVGEALVEVVDIPFPHP